MKIDILKSYPDAEPIRLGTMSPPDHLLVDSRSKNDDFFEVVLRHEWDNWRSEVEQPDCDTDFIDYLRSKGWTRKNGFKVVVI